MADTMNAALATDCTCEPNDEYDDHRHHQDCVRYAFLLDDPAWRFYCHDGELESGSSYPGGVFANPGEPDRIYLRVRDYIVPAWVSEDEDD